MQDARTSRVGWRSARRPWRGPGLRLKLVLILVSALVAGWGTFALIDWWIEWPARAVLRAEGTLYPGAFSPDGSVLATRVYPTEEIILWDMAGGRARSTWEPPDRRSRFAGTFSPDGRTFALPWYLPRTGKDFSVDLIDVATGKVRSTFDAPHGGFLGLRFLEGGSTVRLLAAGPTAQALVDVDVASGVVLAGRPVAAARPTAFYGFHALSFDGRHLAVSGPVAAGSAKGSADVSIWDLDRDAEACSIPGTPGGPSPVRAAFSPDGKTLALAREDGPIELWDLPTRRLRRSTAAHARDYASVFLTFSPDGATLASTGTLRRIRPLSIDFVRAVLGHYLSGPDPAEPMELVLLDVATGRRIRSSHRNGIAAFSPDGRTLATSHDDGTIKLYDVPKSH